MNNKTNTDVLVVGMGMAGMMAAYAAAQRGKNVTLLATGLGALTIASGCIDVLGYTQKDDTSTLRAVQNPFTALEALPSHHPYHLVGKKGVEASLRTLQEIFTTYEGDFLCKEGKNTWVPTIIGTLKPTYFYPASSDTAPLLTAKHIQVVSVDAIRDCHPQLIVQQLQKYPAYNNSSMSTALLTSHFGTAHRAVSPLDVARYVDTDKGFQWLASSLAQLNKNTGAFLVPPILGTGKKSPSVWKKLQEKLGCPVVEMLSLPPGVGGQRLYTVFLQALRAQGVRIIENATISHAEIIDKRCMALFSQGEGVSHRHEAQNFILATGGILGGGIETKPGKAFEKILGIELDTPPNQEQWAADTAFGDHAFTKMGVHTNEKLQAIDNQGTPLVNNIYFAGRTLGNYDFAAEKSGNGVAIATGWHAAQHI